MRKNALNGEKNMTVEKCPFHPLNGGNCNLANTVSYCHKWCEVRMRIKKEKPT
jgi:hypothetical protein